MRNKIIILFIVFFYTQNLFAENIKISAKNIILDKNKNSSIFKDEVTVLTVEGDSIKSDYAEYNKGLGILILKDNVYFTDKLNNNLIANFIEYQEKEKIM